MITKKQASAYISLPTFVTAITFAYLLVSIAFIPYLHKLSSIAIQKCLSYTSSQFLSLIDLLSIITMVNLFKTNQKEKKSIKKLWLTTLVTLLNYQAFNFILHSLTYNSTLQSRANKIIDNTRSYSLLTLHENS
ncbi:hypothetical protein A8C32_02160 [Flavivirga aquatica]|uniref:Uncharacterized protein n=1 Tax=Flavivirga aquatica TaxID=1849968 RepID=A0A1E5TA73_9FLAO|nr:hypothetical protein [Flavivirga aquatica]OEK08283.1 hypothetical protein A8C32_02160 [Flavivirga aquatica]